MSKKDAQVDEVIINGAIYVPKGTQKEPAESLKGMKYVIVRSDRAGVFAGYLVKKEGQNVIMKQARRLWYWKGAASLSQLAMEGVKSPDECKFPIAVDSQEIDGVIEVLDCTKKAQESINNVKVWQL